MDELKPCPFCGVKPIIRQWPFSNDFYVECVNPKCTMNPSTGLKRLKNINQHIKAWNRRVGDNEISRC